MRIGTGKQEIRFLADFFPTEGFVSQLHPIHARAAVLEGERRFVLISLEMTSLPDDVTEELRELSARAADTALSDAWVAVTHTFSAPHFMPEAALRTQEDREHRQILHDLVVSAITGAIAEARANAEECQITLHCGESQTVMSRDIELPEGWWVGFGGTGNSDPALHVLRAQSGERTKLVIYHLNLQPSVLDGTGAAQGKTVSGDMTGIASAEIEELFPDAVAIFMIGAAGDQAPVEKAKGLCRHEDGSVSDIDLHEQGGAVAERLGAQLAKEVLRTLELHGEPISGTPVMESAKVMVPAKKMNRNLKELHPCHNCTWEMDGEGEQPIELFALGDLAFVGVRPELTYTTDQFIRENSPYPHTLVCTLVNGGAKYMAARDVYEKYMYEAINSPFAPGAAERLANSAVTMLKGLR